MAYRTILLAYDGSKDGRRVLMEGADLAKGFGAKTHLLAVITEKSGAAIAQSLASASPVDHTLSFRNTIDDGVKFFKRRGIEVEGHVARGEPCAEIAKLAKLIGADLVIVGHRPHGTLARWWTTPTCMSLLDQLHCGVLVCRQEGDVIMEGVEQSDQAAQWISTQAGTSRQDSPSS
ncbi:MAG TPA: universal stress protein [Gammaproteobacteria bacterium]|jgi:nucleotide-binding universal stress UspA family protein